MAIRSLTTTSSDVDVRKLLCIFTALVLAFFGTLFALISIFFPQISLRFTLKLPKSHYRRFIFTFFSRSFLFANFWVWVLFDEPGFESVSASSVFTLSKFALEFDGTELVSGEISAAAAKTENLAARSTRVLLEGKVRLPLVKEEEEE